MEAISDRTKELQINWELKPFKGKTSFSADEMINAYLQGRDDQADANKQLILEKLKDNLHNAKQISVEMYDFIKGLNFKCKRVHLRIKDIYRYSLLFVINEDDFCNDEFIKVYEYSIIVKKRVNISSMFDVTIIFTPESESLNIGCLLSDGYNLSYGREE